MGGLTFDKLLIILVIALVVLGPERLPYYAQKLGELVKGLKRMADGAKDRVKDEMGDEFDEVDWKQLDPRQYDPRRIIRDALWEEQNSPEARRARAAAASRARREASATAASATAGVVATGAVAAGGLVTESTEPIESETTAEIVFNYDDEAT